ncbi:MAG: hypothetical protein R3D00_23950 [Bacteroidia bacterium]
MYRIKLSIVALILMSVLACKNESNNDVKGFASGTTEINATGTLKPKTQGTVVLKTDGQTYTFEMSDDDSELKFYTAESILNVDAACEIHAKDGNSTADIVIEGMGKGKDQYEGNVSLSSTQSVASFTQGENKFSFTEGNIEIEDFSKNTGIVKLKVSGIGTMQKGNSYQDMKVDISAEMEVNVTISNIRTYNYTQSNQ